LYLIRMKGLLFLAVIATLALYVAADASHFEFLNGVKGLGGQPRQQQPPIIAGGICRDRFVPWECPIYEYIPDFGLEFRYYPGPIAFVASSAYGPPGNLLEGYLSTAYYVEQYLNGTNSLNQRYRHTAPVQVVVEAGNIVVWFYSTFAFLPYNVTVAAPTSPFVRIVRVPAGSGFVMAVQNFAPTPLMEDGNENAERVIFGAAHGLWEVTQAIGVPIFDNLYVFNDYQPPYVRQNRRHENWFEVRRTSTSESVLSAALHEGLTEEGTIRL